MIAYHVKHRPDGTWGVYDDDDYCHFTEGTEYLAHRAVAGAEAALAAPPNSDGEKAYERGYFIVNRLKLWPLGIIPESPGTS